MKVEMLATAPHSDSLVAVVEEVERRAVQEAELSRPARRTTGSSSSGWHPPWRRGRSSPTAPMCSRRSWWSPRTGGSGGQPRRPAPTGSGGPLEHLAVFVASYHPPNLRAAETIVEMAAAMPTIGFLLVGSHGSHFSDWRLPANVLVTGPVSDRLLATYLAASDVALNPVRSGGGTNLKLIEYFAGVPTVSTSLGARWLHCPRRRAPPPHRDHRRADRSGRATVRESGPAWTRARAAWCPGRAPLRLARTRRVVHRCCRVGADGGDRSPAWTSSAGAPLLRHREAGGRLLRRAPHVLAIRGEATLRPARTLRRADRREGAPSGGGHGCHRRVGPRDRRWLWPGQEARDRPRLRLRTV